MAITHVQVVTIYVSNQQEALNFYVDKFGFEKTRDDPMGPDMRWIEVRPPGAQTRIVLAHGFGRDDWLDEIGKSELVVGTDDIHATYEELKGRGVEFTEPPTLQPWGMMQALFRDQDGNLFVMVQEPGA